MNSRVLSAGSVLLPVIILSAAACPISAKSGHIRSTPSPTAAVRAANEAATIEPKTGDFVNAGLVYAYSENAVYRVYTVPERVTDVALQTGEELVAVGEVAIDRAGADAGGIGDVLHARLGIGREQPQPRLDHGGAVPSRVSSLSAHLRSGFRLFPRLPVRSF